MIYLKGLAMGSADVIPGVSGGTIAFITGIYDRLIGAINSINLSNLKLLLKRDWKGFAAAIDFKFLAALFLGIFTAILSLAKLITYLLENHEVSVWSFFFGLILASAFLILGHMKNRSVLNIILILVGTAIAYYLTSMGQTQTPDNLFGIFLSGCIAIIAMILPGISGSYILVMLGKYKLVLGSISEAVHGDVQAILTVGVFAAGCLVGLLSFARVLKWLFDNYHDAVIAALTGFMIGSLNKVWPWKETVETYIDRHGEIKPLTQLNVLPPAYDSAFFIALGLAILGIVIVVGLDRAGKLANKA